MDFPPILILVLAWLLIGLPISMLSKASREQAARKKAAAARPAGQPAEAPKPEGEGSFSRPTVLRPSISLTEHDDSIYQGSLGAVTGEGYDPCHEEQLAPLTAAETRYEAVGPAAPGLQLNWTGNEIVRGIVMSEILKRKT